MTSHSSITLPGLGEVPVVALGSIGNGSVPPGFGSDDEEGGLLGYGLSSVSMLTSMAMAARFGRREFTSSSDRDGVPDGDAAQSDNRQQARPGQPGLLDIHRRVAELSLNTPRPPPASRPDEFLLGGRIAPRVNWRWGSMGRSSDEVEDYQGRHRADSIEEVAFGNRAGNSYIRGGNGHSDEDDDDDGGMAMIGDSEDDGELYTEYFDEDEEDVSYEARTSSERSPVTELGLPEAAAGAPAFASSLESATSGSSRRRRRRRSSRRGLAQNTLSTIGGPSATDSQEAEALLAAHRSVSVSRATGTSRQLVSDATAPLPPTSMDPAATPAPPVTIPPLASSSPAPLGVPPARPPTRRGRSLAFAWAAARFVLSAMLAPLRLFLSITGLSERAQHSAGHPAAGRSPTSRPIVLSAASTSLSYSTSDSLAADAREHDPHDPHRGPHQQADSRRASSSTALRPSSYSGAGAPLRPPPLSGTAAEEARPGGSDGRGGVCSTAAGPLPPPPPHSTCLVGVTAVPTLPTDAAVTREPAVLAHAAAAGASGSGSGISTSQVAPSPRVINQQPQSQLGQVALTPFADVARVLPDFEAAEDPVGVAGPCLAASDDTRGATACQQTVALPLLGADSNGCVSESPGTAPTSLPPASEAAARSDPALSCVPMTARTPLEEWTEDDMSLDGLDLHSTGDAMTATEHSTAESHADRTTAPLPATGTGTAHQVPDSGDRDRGASGTGTLCTAAPEGSFISRTRVRPRLAWQAAASYHGAMVTSAAATDSGSGPEDAGVDADTESSEALWGDAAWRVRREANPGQLLGGQGAGAGVLSRQRAGAYSPRRERQQGPGAVASAARDRDPLIADPDRRAHRTGPSRQHRGRRPRIAHMEACSRFGGLLGPRTGAASGSGASEQPPQTEPLVSASPHDHDNGGGDGGDGGMSSLGLLVSLAGAVEGADQGCSSRQSASPATGSAVPPTAGGAVLDAWRDAELADLEEIAMQVLGEVAIEPVGGGVERRLSVPPLTDASSSSNGSVFDVDVGDDGLVSRWAIPRRFSTRGVCQAGGERGTQPGFGAAAAAATPEGPALAVAPVLGDSESSTWSGPAGLIVPPLTHNSRGGGDAAELSSGDDSDEVEEVWLSPRRWGGERGAGGEEPALLSFAENDAGRQMPPLFSEEDDEDEGEEGQEEEGAVALRPLRPTASGNDTPPPPLFSDDSGDENSETDDEGNDDVMPPLFSTEDDNMVIGDGASDMSIPEEEQSRGQNGDTANEGDSAESSDDDDEPPPLLSSGELNPTDPWDIGILHPPPARNRARVLQPQPPHPIPLPDRPGPAATNAASSTSRAAPPRAGPGAHSWISDPWLVPLSRAVTGAAARSTTPSQPSATGGASAPIRSFPRPVGLQRPQAPELQRASSPPRAEARLTMPALISSSDDTDDDPDGIRSLGRRIHTFGRRLQQASDRAAALVAARREATAAAAAASTLPGQHRPSGSATTAPSPGGLRLELGAAAEAVLEALVPALLGAASANTTASLIGVSGGGGASVARAAPPTSSSRATGPNPDRTPRPRPAGVTTQILSAVIRLPADALSSVPNGSVLSITLPPLGEGIVSGSGATDIGTTNGGLRLQLGGVSSFPMSWRSYLPSEDSSGRNPNDRPWLPGTYEEHEIPTWAARFAPRQQAEARRPDSSPGVSGDTSPRGTEVGAGNVEGDARASSSNHDPTRSDAPSADPNSGRTADADPAGQPALWEDFSFATDSAESIDSLPDLIPLDYVPAGTVPPARRRSLAAEVRATHTREGVPRQEGTPSADTEPLPPAHDAQRRSDRASGISSPTYVGEVHDDGSSARRQSANEGGDGQDRSTEVWQTGSVASGLDDPTGQAANAGEATSLPDSPRGTVPGSASEPRPSTEEAHRGAGTGRRQVANAVVGTMGARGVAALARRRARSVSLPMWLPLPSMPGGDGAAQEDPTVGAELGARGVHGSGSTPVATEQELALGAAAGGAAAGSAVGASTVAARRNAVTHVPSRILHDMLDAIQNVEAAAATSIHSGPRDRFDAQRNVRLARTNGAVETPVPVAADRAHRTSSEMRRQVAVAALLRDDGFVGQVLEGMAGVEAHPPAIFVAETVRWMMAGPLAAVHAV